MSAADRGVSLEVREADLLDASDAADVIDVLDSYARDPMGGGRPLAAEVRERLVPALREQPTALVLLAFLDGRAVGLAISFYGMSTFAARPLLNVHDLAVVPDQRGRGIGRALLAVAEEHARRRNCCKLTLEVQDGNTRARGLYRSFGFADFEIADTGPTRFLSKPLDSALQVREADYAGEHERLARIRFAVFVDEQHVPAEIELDDRDVRCIHVLAIDAGRDVGTARIDLEHGGKIGRLAVLAAARRRGIGTALMQALHTIARRNGLASVWCNAQLAAVPFYETLGYAPVGEHFDEAGIEHVRMERTL